jgi:hypothetical protein
MPWTIIDGPDAFRERKDARGWVWSIEREAETRQLGFALSVPALLVHIEGERDYSHVLG